MLTFDEASFDMSAEVTIDGAQVPGEFIEEAFHQTFGSATVPYTCNDDGTVTITYDTPTGPATAVHEPAWRERPIRRTIDRRSSWALDRRHHVAGGERFGELAALVEVDPVRTAADQFVPRQS